MTLITDVFHGFSLFKLIILILASFIFTVTPLPYFPKKRDMSTIPEEVPDDLVRDIVNEAKEEIKKKRLEAEAKAAAKK